MEFRDLSPLKIELLLRIPPTLPSLGVGLEGVRKVQRLSRSELKSDALFGAAINRAACTNNFASQEPPATSGTFGYRVVVSGIQRQD